MLARGSDSSLMKLDQKNVAFQMHHCSLAALWGLPDWDDKLAILCDVFYPLSVCKALFLFFMGFFFYFFKAELKKRLKLQIDWKYKQNIAKVGETLLVRFVLAEGRAYEGNHATRWLLPLQFAQTCWPSWLNTSHTSLHWSCSWSVISNNWPCCFSG